MVVRPSTQPAFSLLEVIVALALLSIGMLAVAGTGVMAVRLLNEANAQEAAVTRASSVLDSLLQLSGNTADYIETVGHRVEWSAADSVARVRVRITRAGKHVAELHGVRP